MHVAIYSYGIITRETKQEVISTNAVSIDQTWRGLGAKYNGQQCVLSFDKKVEHVATYVYDDDEWGKRRVV